MTEFAKNSIIRHFETICSVDQGSDINPEVRAVKSIVEKLVSEDADQGKCTGRGEHYFFIDVAPGKEAAILRGADINLDLDAEDYHLFDSVNDHSLTVTEFGMEELIDYLADMTKNYFWYAQEQLGKTNTKKRAKRPARRTKKTA